MWSTPEMCWIDSWEVCGPLDIHGICIAQVAPVQSKFNTIHQIRFKWAGLQLVNQGLEFELLHHYSFPSVKLLQSKNRELDPLNSLS